MSLEISRRTRNETSEDSTLRVGEPMSGKPSQAELRDQNQADFFARALDSGVYPIVDKDAAEIDLQFLRKGAHPFNIDSIEEQVRDGNPIMTHIAIVRLRTKVRELSRKPAFERSFVFPTKAVVFEASKI